MRKRKCLSHSLLKVNQNRLTNTLYVEIRLTCPQPTRLCYAFSAAKTVVFKITKIIHNPQLSIIRGDCNWLFFTKNLMLLPFFRISQVVSCKQKPFIFLWRILTHLRFTTFFPEFSNFEVRSLLKARATKTRENSIDENQFKFP